MKSNIHVIYMPSTPLNVLVCIAHAFANRRTQSAKLVLIDQQEIVNNFYFKALLAWPESPFKEVFVTCGQAKGLAKFGERRQNFKILKKILNDFPADVIAVGSDRRIEFQYLMYLGQKSNKSIEGWYMDDGLYSYAGRPSVWYKDLINGLIKKIIYGFWWKEPKTIGTSSWIKQAWLFRPQVSVNELQSKISHSISADWLAQKELLSYSRLICEAYNLDDNELLNLGLADLCILIPHPNNIKKMPGYQQRLEYFLSRLSETGKRLIVKYHPRTRDEDFFKLREKYNAILLPKGLAFEFVLSFLSKDMFIVGDVGTALLTARWLRPDLKVYAVLGEDKFPNKFRQLYKEMDVNISMDFKDLLDTVIRHD